MADTITTATFSAIGAQRHAVEMQIAGRSADVDLAPCATDASVVTGGSGRGARAPGGVDVQVGTRGKIEIANIPDDGYRTAVRARRRAAAGMPAAGAAPGVDGAKADIAICGPQAHSATVGTDDVSQKAGVIARCVKRAGGNGAGGAGYPDIQKTTMGGDIADADVASGAFQRCGEPLQAVAGIAVVVLQGLPSVTRKDNGVT